MIVVKCSHSERSSDQSLQFQHSTHQNFNFISISVRFVLALIRRNTLYSFCIPNEPSPSTAITLASSFRTRCFFSTDKRSLSTNNVCIPFSRSSPNLRFQRSTYPIRPFSHRLQTASCNFPELPESSTIQA